MVTDVMKLQVLGTSRCRPTPHNSPTALNPHLRFEGALPKKPELQTRQTPRSRNTEVINPCTPEVLWHVVLLLNFFRRAAITNYPDNAPTTDENTLREWTERFQALEILQQCQEQIKRGRTWWRSFDLLEANKAGVEPP